MQHILALIPARGGSKRLPGKNTLQLGDKPLIAWTISAAAQSQMMTDIIVSTDDQDIAEVSRTWGAQVPWLRPAALATDTAGSVDVALHALDWYESERGKVDGIMLLQPTSPFRQSHTIQSAVRAFAQHHLTSLVSASPASAHPAWCFRVEGDQLVPVLGWEAMQSRSQDLVPAYTFNGAIYLSTPDSLRSHRSFVTPSTYPLVIHDPVESLDIDTPFDWSLAELFQQQLAASTNNVGAKIA